MKLSKDAITRVVARQALQMKKQSPHIFFAVGIAGVVGSTVLACRATLKVEEKLDDIKDDVERVKTKKESPQAKIAGYSDSHYYRDLGQVYGRGAAKLVKLYGPSFVVGSMAVGALTGSHIQMTRRNGALTVTLAAMSEAFDQYRVRVRNELGEEKEYDLYSNSHIEKIDGPNGKEKLRVTDGELSIYSRWFDEGSSEFTKNAEANRIFITLKENYLNHRLQAYGHVFLNEVYDELGIPRSPEGAIVGWFYNGDGDNYIDFGTKNVYQMTPQLQYEPRIRLDFNVDGVIYDKI